jgi:hypothetical protein
MQQIHQWLLITTCPLKILLSMFSFLLLSWVGGFFIFFPFPFFFFFFFLGCHSFFFDFGFKKKGLNLVPALSN